jgi:hypothetical protein
VEKGEFSPTLAAETPTTGLNFYRSHRRVVLFLFLAPVFYEIWWYWQLFAFARRESFPSARRVWWLLIPIYGWVVLYRQFDDLKHAASRAGLPVRSSALAIWFVIFSWWVGSASNRISSSYGSFAAFVVSGVLIAIVGLLVQPTANAYLRNKYAVAAATGMTWGELTAAALGTLLFALFIVITFTSAFSSSSSSVAARRPAVATRVLSHLRPIAVRTGDVVTLAGTSTGCIANRYQRVVWLDCAPLTASSAVPGSFGVSISIRGAILERVDKKGNAFPLIQRSEPATRGLVGVPVPRRKPQTSPAPVGAVLPIGGSSVICDIERLARVPTLFCGLANKVTGPNNALNVGYLPSSYGVMISKVAAAVVRWDRSGNYTTVTRRREPRSPGH